MLFRHQVNQVMTLKLISILSETGDFIDDDPLSVVEIMAGSTSGGMEIYTGDDTIDENDGEITVSILPGIGYQVVEGLESFMTTVVTDNDVDSVVSIEANFPSITEGQNVGFEISATTASTVPRFIPVDIKNTSGNFLSESESTTFHLNANERTAFLSIPTFDNIYFETNGGITAEIHRGDGYTIAESPNNVATVAVLDNDAPTGLSIIELNDMIAEGEVARFQITAHNAEPVDRIIELQVSDNGGYINGTIPTSITLPAANTTYILEFQTLDNSLDAPSGEIIVTIEPSTEYNVAAGTKQYRERLCARS